MSGCGRKHRAKHLVGQYLDDEAWKGPDVQKGDTLAVCVGPPSGKHLHVLRVPVAYVTYPDRLQQLLSSLVPNVNNDGIDREYSGKGISSFNNTELGKSEVSEHITEVTANEPDNILEKQRELVRDTMGSVCGEKGIVSLPGKFNKVLWLASKDIIVERDGTVQYKPSNAQLKNYFDQWEADVTNICINYQCHNTGNASDNSSTDVRNTAGTVMPTIRECVAKLQGQAALGPLNRLSTSETVSIGQQQKQQTVGTVTTKRKCNRLLDGFGGSSNHAMIIPTTPQHQSLQERIDLETNHETIEYTTVSGVSDAVDDDDLCCMINPNRDNIKHRNTYFSIL